MSFDDIPRDDPRAAAAFLRERPENLQWGEACIMLQSTDENIEALKRLMREGRGTV